MSSSAEQLPLSSSSPSPAYTSYPSREVEGPTISTILPGRPTPGEGASLAAAVQHTLLHGLSKVPKHASCHQPL